MKRLVGRGKSTSFPPAPAGKMYLEERAHPEDRSQGFVVYEVDVCPECDGSGCKRCEWEGVFEGEVPAWAQQLRAQEVSRRPEIAVNCCYCSKDLTDALSQERGYGPICARKYGLVMDTTERPAANVEDLIAAAIDATDPDRRHVAEKVRDWREDKKTAAKRLAYLLSFCSPKDETDAQLRALDAMGFHSMAGLIAATRDSHAVAQASKRKATITIRDTNWGKQIFVETPCRPPGDGLDECRAIEGRRYDRDARANRFPVKAWDQVVAWVKKYYPLSEIPERPEVPEACAPPEKKEKIVLALIGKRMVCYTPYDREFIRGLKTFPDRQWMCLTCGKPARPKCEEHFDGPHGWTVPLDAAQAVRDMVERFFPGSDQIVMPDLQEALEHENAKVEAANGKVAVQITMPNGRNLFGFQNAGVRYLELANGNAIVADEQGLGKTVQAIAYNHRNLKDGQRVLYVVPANVKFNWVSELTHWLGGFELGDRSVLKRARRGDAIEVADTAVQMLSGSPGKRRELSEAPHVVINYDVLGRWEKQIKEAKFDIIVADEAHYLKNDKSARSKAFYRIANGLDNHDRKKAKPDGYPIERRILLTGTPIINRPKDLWNLLRLVDEETWGNFFKYGMRYCDGQSDYVRVKGGSWRKVWDFSGASNHDELHQRLNGHQWIRRVKADVLTDLPPKVRNVVNLDVSSHWRSFYKQVEREEGKALAAGGHLQMMTEDGHLDPEARKAVLASITRLRMALAQAKAESVGDWIEDLVESVGKVVVFCRHKSMVSELANRFGGLVIDGSTTGYQRAEAVKKFQDDPDAKVIVCSIEAAAVGITLTASSHLVFVERVWRAGDHKQAEDRIHRIGQQDQATIWYLDMIESFDEVLRQVVDFKALQADRMVDGQEVEQEKSNALQATLDYFKQVG